MRVLSAGLQDHLDSGATTLCWCWRITRNDGTRLGFTDDDRDLDFDGTSFEASTGFTGTEIAGSVGLNVDTLDVEGALKSERLNEADLAAGLYDNALIEIYRVNWGDPSMRVLMRYGNLGEVSRGQHHFSCEVRGLAHELQQPKGRIVQYGCDADLGDQRCKINLNQPAYRSDGGAVASLSGSPRLFAASGLDAYANGWFSRGLITWLSGANAGPTAQVKVHAKANGSVSIEVWQRTSETIAPGDQFSIVAGCDKQVSTCKAKFANVANFRGFPHVPGNDFMLSVATRQGKNDGNSRFK